MTEAKNRFLLRLLLSALAAASGTGATEASECPESRKGLLVAAHGVSSHHGGHPGHGGRSARADEWENTVRELVGAAAERIPHPVSLAFGMWNRASLQAALSELAAAGACRIQVIPLFISSHSVVIEAQKYQLHVSERNPLPFDPGRVEVPASIGRIHYGAALDDHPALSGILASRARALSRIPGREEVILVAHGPVEEEEDRLWHRDLAVHASRIQESLATDGSEAFAAIHAFTLQDDAAPAIRERKSGLLRELVGAIRARGNTPLIVPVLMASGGIEKGLLRRLEGLEFVYQARMLAPDPRLVDWIVDAATR